MNNWTLHCKDGEIGLEYTWGDRDAIAEALRVIANQLALPSTSLVGDDEGCSFGGFELIV